MGDLDVRQLSIIMLGLITIMWVVHVAVALVLSSPFLFFGRKRVSLNSCDWFALVVPYGVWFVLRLLKPIGKNDLDSLFEPFLISLAIALAALVRVVIGRKIQEQTVSISLICILSVVAVMIYLFDPTTHDSM